MADVRTRRRDQEKRQRDVLSRAKADGIMPARGQCGAGARLKPSQPVSYDYLRSSFGSDMYNVSFLSRT